jgi:hypothetical protein
MSGIQIFSRATCVMIIGIFIYSLVQNICGKLRPTTVRVRKWNGRVGLPPVAGSSIIHRAL